MIDTGPAGAAVEEDDGGVSEVGDLVEEAEFVGFQVEIKWKRRWSDGFSGN